MTNILLINVHSSRNLGDDALTLVTIQQLKENFPGCYLTMAMDDPESGIASERVIGSFFNWVKPAGKEGRSKWKITRLFGLLPATLLPLITRRMNGKPVWLLTPAKMRSLLEGYFAADLIVSKPGGFLYSSGLGLVLLISIYSMALSVFAGKPLYIFPQSIGPLRHWWERSLLRWLASRTRQVMVREEISYRLMRNLMGNSTRCTLIPDPAFALQADPPEKAIEWFEKNQINLSSGSPHLGVTVVNWNAENPNFQNQDKYESAIASTARYFIHHYGGTVIFFTQVWGPSFSQDDRVPSRRVIARLQDVSSNLHHIQELLTPTLVKAIYGSLDVFLGTRMHSNIFALSQGIPVIAISYQPKTEGIMHMFNLDNWMIPIQEVNEQRLIEMLSSLVDRKQAIAESISSILPAIIAQANQPGQLAAQDFRKFQECK